MGCTLLVGDRVKLSGRHLRSTGQTTGSGGQSVWTIQGFDGEWAITDEPVAFDCWTPEEHAADPSLKWRRIHVGNLYRVGTVDHR